MRAAKWSHGPATVGIFFHKPNNIRFCLNKQARYDMGFPQAVTIDYDKKKKILSFSPCDVSHPDGYSVGVFGQIHGAGIIKRYDLKPCRNVLLVNKQSDIWEAVLEQI